MQTIDFLPAHYRERRKQNRVRWWWALVVGLFGGVVLLTSSLQWLNVQRMKAELARLESQVATSRQLDQHLLELESKVDALSHHANLFTFLRHPWPRTQILAAVVEPLPAELRLTSIRVAESLIARPTAAAPAPESTSETAPPAHPAVADLQQLYEAHESQRVVVVLDGTAAEVEHLHRYLDALGQHPLIAEARLNTLETRKVEAGKTVTGTNETSKPATQSLVVFQLQLTVKSGHGLSDGPTGPLAQRPNSETASFIQEPLRWPF